MMQNVHYLHGEPSSIDWFVEVGHTGHRQIDDMIAAGRLSPRHIVVDAAQLEAQKELINSCQQQGRGVVLDPCFADLAFAGRSQGSVRSLPWAHPEGRQWLRSDFDQQTINGLAEKISEAAIKSGASRVLAPTHAIMKIEELGWLDIDVKLAIALREALDRSGGKHIELDYPLMPSYALYQDVTFRSTALSLLADVPFDHLWLRIVNFGREQAAAGFDKYMKATLDFHGLHRPIVADRIGGLVGLGLLAFGSVSAIANGVLSRERASVSGWSTPSSGGGGGQKKRTLFAGIDSTIAVDDARAIFNARGAKTLLGCQDPTCCRNGIQDMLGHPLEHAAVQKERQIADLEAVSDLKRAEHFTGLVAKVERTARQAAKLKVEAPKLVEKLEGKATKIERLLRVSETLTKRSSNFTRAQPLAQKAKSESNSHHTRKDPN